MRKFAFIFSFLLPIAALAQQPSSPPAAGAEKLLCAHAGVSVAMGEIDLTVLKCQLAVAQKRLADAEADLIGYQAAASVASNDLANERKSAEQHAKDLGAWFRGWFGEPEGAAAK